MPTSLLRQSARYGFAVLTSGTALLVRLVVTRYIGPGLPPFLFLFPAVMLTATLCGLGPGLLATAVSALLAAYFILPPEGFAVGSPVDLLGLVIFAWMGTGISLVAQWVHRARDRATRSATDLAGPAEEDAAPLRSPHRPGGAPGTVLRRAPLRRWLTLLVLGTAGPLLAFAVVVLVWLVGGYRADQDRRQTDTTRALALAVDAEIRSWEAALQALAGSHELQHDRLAGFYQEAHVVAAQHEGWIFLYDASGQQRLNTLRPFGDPLPKTGTPELWQAFFRDRQPIVTDLLVGPVVHRDIMAVAVPVIRDGQVLYALGMAFGPERLTRLLADQRLPATWITAIIDGRQRVVARAPDRPDRRGQPVVPPLARAFAAQESGSIETLLSDGRVGRNAFQRLREAHWTVNVTVPVTELQAAWQRPVLAFLVLGGLAALGAVGLAVGLARKIARPVSEAARLAPAVVHGEAPDFPPSRIAEVAELQHALADGAATVRAARQAQEQAADALRQANETLETRVAERTAALQASERRYRSLVELAPDAVLVHQDRRIVFANAAAVQLYGAEAAAQLHGTDVLELVHPDDRARVQARIQRVQAGEIAPILEVRHRRLDGQEVPVETTAAPTDWHGQGAMQVIIRDVTERQRAEKALRDSEQRFRHFYDSDLLGVIFWNMDGVITDANDKFLTMVGHDRTDLTAGRIDWGNMTPPEYRHLDEASVEELKATGVNKLPFEKEYIRKDGSRIPIIIAGAMLDEARFNGVAFVLDITKRKLAEWGLQTTLQRFYVVLSSMYSEVLLVSDEGQVEFANQAFCDRFGLAEAPADLVGLASQEMIGKIKHAYLHPDEAVARIREILDRKQPVRGEELAMHDGRTCLRDFVPLNVGGKSYGRLWLHFDITARKQVEERLQQTLAELERSNQELEQFAYVASHDLQEPLRMVASYTQLLARRYQDRLDADANDFIAFAVDGATRMQRLIQDLLAYSRVTTHGAGLERTSAQVALQDALRNLQAAIQDSGAVITHDALPPVLADATQLTQVFQNLIGNALKFRGEAPPRVHVSVRPQGEDWVFAVQDNGIGIDPQFFERIFVIFQRLHTPDRYPGTGIGLALCQRIVQRHGGRLWVESTPGQGATFSFTLKRREGTQI